MSDPYYFPEVIQAVQENLIHQTADQLGRCFAQTMWNVYELTDEQYRDLMAHALGSGSMSNFTPGRPVYINAEVVLRVKPKGTHTQTVLPFTG